MSWNPEDADRVRTMIRHEDDVMNHRLSWFVALNGLLFASLGFSWGDAPELIPVLAAVGAVSSLSWIVPLFLSDSAIRRLVEDWRRNKPHNYRGPDVIAQPPMPRLAHLFLPWLLLPVLLAAAWTAVWVISRG
jgi:hypothetical protein